MNTNPENQKQINKLRSLVGQKGNTALTVLFELQNIKKQQNKSIDESIRTYRKVLIDAVMEVLLSKIPNSNLQNFLRVPVFREGERKESLIELIAGSTLKTGISYDGCPYVMSGSGLVNVKEEDVIPYSPSFKDCGEKCDYINILWEGLAKISCNDNSLKEFGLIGFGFNASGFIHPPKVVVE